MPYQNNRLPNQSFAQDFDLPDQRYLAQPQQGAPVGPGGYQPTLPVPAPQNGLADVEGMTDKYYDTWGKLQSLTQGMWKDYGIDITQPDFTQQGGGTPFKTYQKLSGVLMNTANKLGNRMKEQTQAAPYKFTGQIHGEGTDQDPYVSNDLLPEVVNMQKIAEEALYTTGDVKRANEQIDRFLPELEKQAATGDPYMAHNYEVAKATKAKLQIHPSFFKNEEADKKAALKKAAGASKELAVLKEIIPIAKGHWRPGSYKTGPDPADPAKIVAINMAHSGENLGQYTPEGSTTPKPRLIDYFVKNNRGEVYIRFKPPEEGVEPPPDERVDNQGGFQITSKFQENNPTYGKTTNTAAAVQAMDLADLGGYDVNDEKLFDKDYQDLTKLGEGVNQDISAGQAATDLKVKTRNQLEGIPRGSTVTVGGLDITNNWLKGYGIKDEGRFSLDEIMKKIEESGYFNGTPSTESPSQGPPTITTKAAYDALPSGTAYIDSKGVKATKK